MPEIIEAIRDPKEIQRRSLGLFESAKSEILIIFPTAECIPSSRPSRNIKLIK